MPTGSDLPPGTLPRMAFHAALAAAFFFVLQHFVLKENVATSLLWAGFFAAAAAILAYAQARKRTRT
jgi:hypothetical protein